MGALIHIENMKKIYNPGENEVRALDGIDLDIERGDLVAIVGHSGSGKSTLAKMVFLGLALAVRASTLLSGTATVALLGSMVQKG